MVKALFLGLIASAAIGAPEAAPRAITVSPAPKAVTRSEFGSKLDASFAATDTNHDGSLSVDELQAEQNRELAQFRAAIQARLKAAFDRLDTNKDGQLNFQEFSATIPSVTPSETAAQTFQRLDANHDGKVSASEFRAPRMTEFDRADVNHDGIVTPQEDEAYRKAHQKK